MKLGEALKTSLKADKNTRANAFLLYSRVSDMVSDDYEAKEAAEQFFQMDSRHGISKAILSAAPVKYKNRRKLRYKIKPMSPPEADAYVFFEKGSDTLHLSGECPCLKNAETVYCAPYGYARALDFKREHLSGSSWIYRSIHFRSIAKKSRKHAPCICRRCGNFIPRKKSGTLHKILMWIFDHFHINLQRKSVYQSNIYLKKR